MSRVVSSTLCRSGAEPARALKLLVAFVCLLGLSSTSCSLVINKVGAALASGNSVYATDDDPDLVWEAVPFGLKTIEGLLAAIPTLLFVPLGMRTIKYVSPRMFNWIILSCIVVMEGRLIWKQFIAA